MSSCNYNTLVFLPGVCLSFVSTSFENVTIGSCPTAQHKQRLKSCEASNQRLCSMKAKISLYHITSHNFSSRPTLYDWWLNAYKFGNYVNIHCSFRPFEYVTFADKLLSVTQLPSSKSIYSETIDPWKLRSSVFHSYTATEQTRNPEEIQQRKHKGCTYSFTGPLKLSSDDLMQLTTICFRTTLWAIIIYGPLQLFEPHSIFWGSRHNGTSVSFFKFCSR